MINVKEIENWIKNYISSSHAQGVVLGMSGGKDSLVCAKLCANAIGKENVLGIIMPNGKMKDCEIAVKSCEILGIRYHIVDIEEIYNLYINNVHDILEKEKKALSTITTFNVPPRIRMSFLYAVAGSLNYLVCNTSNLSEKEIGYTTKWGDNVGDFAPIVNFTKTEVCDIGLMLGLPKEFVYKAPDDGLSGKTDEEKLGFKYSSLDNLIRTGKQDEDYDKIMKMHKISSHKRGQISSFKYDEYNFFNDNEKE